MSNPEDLLEQTQAELEAADFDEEALGIDRRHFVLLSLAAAAATTLGVEPARAQGRAGGAAATGRLGAQQQETPYPLGNG
ncbi:MAG TPA: hypothetical protein VMV51_10970, partial [Gemmatimonadaceae bacterium]|nr:hypothetical protein [Gemmatimonadaceae bacterium]